jgi:undecaprenyl-phosphate galactose phosphotransferase
MVVLSPLWVVIAILVKLSSRGPVLFATEVIGQNQQRFRWYKFRSMHMQAQTAEQIEHRRISFQHYVEGRHTAKAAVPQKVVEFNQVTPVGRTIRKFSIDEFPQLLNVLRGQMSLVGPRPCLPYEAGFYTGWQARRFVVMSGLTGVWQVFGRGVASFEEAAAMDTFYSYRQSFLFDLMLIFKTIGVMFRGKGAL